MSYCIYLFKCNIQIISLAQSNHILNICSYWRWRIYII